jgi:hypothetical protein
MSHLSAIRRGRRAIGGASGSWPGTAEAKNRRFIN